MALLSVAYWRDAPVPSARAAGDPKLYWSIGALDHSADEFRAGTEKELTYTVGKSTSKKDWCERQSSGSAYRVRFAMAAVPAQAAQLEIDGYFLSSAPAALDLMLNGKKGRVRVEPRAGAETDERQSNRPNYAAAEIRVPLDAGLFRAGENSLEVRLSGEGAFEYDCVRLRRAAEGEAVSIEVQPTIFFRNVGGRLREMTEVAVRHRLPMGSIRAEMRIAGETVSGECDAPFDFGESVLEMALPAVSAPAPYKLTISSGDLREERQGTFKPEKRWRVFAGLKVHNDIGFTDLQPHIQELDTRNTDGVEEIIAKFPFYKFNLETTWLAENYLASRTTPRKQKMIQLARAGQIGVNPIYLNLLTGLCTGEELYRALAASRDIERRYGIPRGAACLTDAPSHTWFLPSWLADAGITAFANGSNQSRAPLLQNSHLNEDSPFYWEGIDGKRVMTWFARSYLQLHRLTENQPTVDRLKRTLPQFLARYRRADYPVDAVLLYGLSVDNAPIKGGEAELLRDWNAAYAFPKIVVATDAEYYAYLKERFADKLPVYRGDAGAYWEDGAASSAAETAINRQTQEDLPEAEMYGAFATLFDPGLRFPAEEFREAWKNLLFYDEHTWGAYNSMSQPDRQFVADQWEYKRAYAIRAQWAAKDLRTRSLNRLAQFISVDGSTLLVFNPQPWERSDVVQVELNDKRGLVSVETGSSVPLDVTLAKDGWIRARFVAEHVPAMGYRAYRLGDAEADRSTSSAPDTPWQIESNFYRVTFDENSGAIASIVDKQLGRELVDKAAPYRANQLVYVAGGDNTRIVRDITSSPSPELTITGQTHGRVIERTRTPYGMRIRIAAEALHTPRIETDVTVYDTLRRIDIVNRIRKDPVRVKEAVYFAFPFRAQQPDPAYEIQNTWIRPNQDQLPGACRDWFATQNAVVVRDADAAIAWSSPDAPLFTLTDINRGKWLRHLDIRNGYVFSYVMNNYWFTNYRAEQGGELVFRYYITSDKTSSPSTIARFSADTRTPLRSYEYFDSMSLHVGPVERRMPKTAGSFLSLDTDHAMVTAFKPADDGNGYVLRIRESAGREGAARLRSPVAGIATASMANGVEDAGGRLHVMDGSVEIPLRPWQFSSVRLTFNPVK
jgi:hypothetical protein